MATNLNKGYRIIKVLLSGLNIGVDAGLKAVPEWASSLKGP